MFACRTEATGLGFLIPLTATAMNVRFGANYETESGG